MAYSLFACAARPRDLLFIALMAMSAIILSPLPSVAASVNQATSGRAARNDAIKSIPMSKLEPIARAEANSIIKNTTIFRRMPLQVTECDPHLYLFLVQHPEVIVNIWQVMGISNVTLDRISENSYSASDGTGTTGNLTICYASQDTHVILAEGSYLGPLSDKPLKAKCLLVLKSGFVQEPSRRWYVTSRLDAFIQMENVGVEILAKTFQPLINKSADYNFAETAGFLSHVSKTAEANPAGMARLAKKLDGVDEPIQLRFAEVSREVADRGAERKQHDQVAGTKAKPGSTRAATRTAGTRSGVQQRKPRG